MRPLLLRVLAVMQVSLAPSRPMWPPLQAPQVGLVTTAPASMKISM